MIMKKVTSLLIGCSLTLAGAAWAQQPVEQPSPSKGKHAPEKAHPAQAQPNAAKPQAPPASHQGAVQQHGATTPHGATHENAATNEPGAGKGRKARTQQESANAPETGSDVSGRAAGMPTHRGKEQVQERKSGQGVKQPATEAGETSATSPTNQQNVQANAGAKAKKPDPQQVQQVKSQHASFRAQPKPQQVQPVTFNQNHRIEGSEHW